MLACGGIVEVVDRSGGRLDAAAASRREVGGGGSGGGVGGGKDRERDRQ